MNEVDDLHAPSMPPSTMRTWPVTCPDKEFEESIRIWVAMSLGFAIFLRGVLKSDKGSANYFEEK
jgi:hypothetical protein